MSEHCCHAPAPLAIDRRYRRALRIALAVNAGMFAAEVAASWVSGSLSLLADAIDFFGDAGNYAISLAVAGSALALRSRAAMFKAGCMGAFGLYVLGHAAWQWHAGEAPQAYVMGAVAAAALVANTSVAALLYRFRGGDANMRSVWICSRNDAMGNIAVMLAAVGVFGTGRSWPDLAVASVIALLALSGAWSVFRQALSEVRDGAS